MLSKFLGTLSDSELQDVQDRAILHNKIQVTYGEPVSEDAALVAERAQDEKERRSE